VRRSVTIFNLLTALAIKRCFRKFLVDMFVRFLCIQKFPLKKDAYFFVSFVLCRILTYPACEPSVPITAYVMMFILFTVCTIYIINTYCLLVRARSITSRNYSYGFLNIAPYV